jgi:hypothetical protein
MAIKKYSRHKSAYKSAYKSAHTSKRNATNKHNKVINIVAVNSVNSVKPTKSKSLCAPFISPKNLSTSTSLDNQNMNIIKSATSHSCFTLDSLQKIADKWNSSHPDKRITYTNKTTGSELWNSINRMMSSVCNNEVCWVRQEFLKGTPLSAKLLKNFKPIMPKSWNANKYQWLNTLDIRDVMNQYEIVYKDFEFIGPVPMDFDTVLGFGQCVINELCKVNLGKLIEKGKKKLGVVFNLDKHTQSGSHWVAMYLDYDIGDIYYWDSYGIHPCAEVTKLMNRLKEQGAKLGKSLTIKVNKQRHQYKNSECGVYCIYFITSLLAGDKFTGITQNIINDDKMNSKRNDFFIKV